METEHLIEQTIAAIRASAIAELRMMEHGHAQDMMTPEEVINTVDWVLREASDALKDMLGDGYLDGQSEQDSWWGDQYQDEFTEVWRGGMVGDRLLPRTRKDDPE